MGPASDFDVAGLVFLVNINSTDDIEGTNQNEAEGADFSAVVDGDLENYGTGNQRTAPRTLRSGGKSTSPSCKVFCKIRRCI